MMLASLQLGPVEFDTPVWLLLIPVLGAITVLIGRKSLSGMAGWTRVAGLIIRLLVIALVAGAMAEPHWRKVSKDVATIVIFDESDSIPAKLIESAERTVEQAANVAKRNEHELLGVITVAKDAYVQTLPSSGAKQIDRQYIGSTDGTNLAAAVRLALGIRRPDAATRILLATDANETDGNLLEAVAAAKAAGVPVDVLPIRYKYDAEVLVDRLIVPANAREGEAETVKVVLQATRPAKGRLSFTINGEPVDLDPNSAATGLPVELEAGPNVFNIPVTAGIRGTIKYEATFEPEMENGRPVGDTRLENNKQAAITFVSGEGRALIVRDDPRDTQMIERVLAESQIATTVLTADQAPTDLAEFNAYDLVIVANEARQAFADKQLDDLKRYVHDSGGGLIMLGGPNSFGAGNWLNSPIEDALPLKLDPPQKREMPKGALAMVIHSVEMPEGVFYGKKVCTAAVDALTSLDMAGIIEWQGVGAAWVHRLAVKGDGIAIKQSINKLQFGDMFDFKPVLQLAIDGLKATDAGQKHVIIVSDGDAQHPGNSLLADFRNAGITITTVGIACHGASDQGTMKSMAEATGGRFYNIDPRQIAELPRIFMKEAQMIKRSLIWEGDPITPTVSGGAAETFKGIRGVPPISGYVVAADREGLSTVTLRGGKENDPIMAQWQFGLGRTIAFTADLSPRWSASWGAWANLRSFWEQHIRWAMRPTGSPNIRVTTETKDNDTLVIVDALDAQGERLSFANFSGRVAAPDGTAQDIQIFEVGPGRYEGRARTDQQGTYVASLKYIAPREGGGTFEGTVQAAINRPFANEYRTLKDNTPLLEQVRSLTGGREVSTGDPEQMNLWLKDGLTFPVAATPIWLTVAVLSIGLFLMDVAIRRVRIDLPAIARKLRGLASKQQAKTLEMSGLAAAKAKAQAGLKTRVANVPPPAPPTAADAAAAKFEISDAEAKARRNEKVGDGSADASKPTEAPKPKSAQQDAAEGMSALLRAKKKARDDIEDR